ncbi:MULTISPECIES: phage holin family protein [Vitreoscilla]|uniref:Phage holin family protein n=1 Tax=Vitreoscilla stercoraria TaxID=61 RepID=A0ABY4EAD9_VITST|nr:MULTISPECIES: phage holin family protein [Vitreoscilla]AUZ05907.1 hypothetical protein ADP71_26090 [Vitreoscilla sp. C1]UOO92723.1 phage holin family protein [Vitreoscilla stercoraria]
MSKDHPSQFSLLKDLLGDGLDLLLIRAKMARVDLLGFKDALLKIILCAIAAVVVAFLGIICLLFALNAVLSPVAKIWVFFGLVGLALIVVASLTAMILNALQSQQAFLKTTLDDLQDDLAYIRGQKNYGDIHIEELEK